MPYNLTLGEEDCLLLEALVINGPHWRGDLPKRYWDMAERKLIPAGYAAAVCARKAKPASYLAVTEAGVNALHEAHKTDDFAALVAAIRERIRDQHVRSHSVDALLDAIGAARVGGDPGPDRGRLN